MLKTNLAAAGALLAALAGAQPAFAAPVSLDKLMPIIREGFGRAVSIVITGTTPTRQSGFATLSIQLENRAAPNQTLVLNTPDGQLPEADVVRTVAWLAQFPSERRAETLAALYFYTMPSRAQSLEIKRVLALIDAQPRPTADGDAALVTPAGEQVGTIEGGPRASFGQELDGLTGAVATVSAREATQGESLASATKKSSAAINGLAAVVRASLSDTQAAASAIVPSLDDGGAGRTLSERLIREQIGRVVEEIQGGMALQRRGAFRTELGLSDEGLRSILTTAGLSDAVAQITESRPGSQRFLLTILNAPRGQEAEILAAGIPMQRGRDGWYMNEAAANGLRRQLDDRTFGALAAAYPAFDDDEALRQENEAARDALLAASDPDTGQVPEVREVPEGDPTGDGSGVEGK